MHQTCTRQPDKGFQFSQAKVAHPAISSLFVAHNIMGVGRPCDDEQHRRQHWCCYTVGSGDETLPNGVHQQARARTTLHKNVKISDCESTVL
jgi:hypothetical protein